MVDGLRLIGSCPRCGGALAFRDEPTATPSAAPALHAGPDDELAPHLVMGVPRR